jgi:hypothetical protein
MLSGIATAVARWRPLSRLMRRGRAGRVGGFCERLWPGYGLPCAGRGGPTPVDNWRAG